MGSNNNSNNKMILRKGEAPRIQSVIPYQGLFDFPVNVVMCYLDFEKYNNTKGERKNKVKVGKVVDSWDENFEYMMSNIGSRIFSKKDLELLNLRWVKKLTLQEVGDMWGITREAVRQSEAKMLNKLFAEEVMNYMIEGKDKMEKLFNTQSKVDELITQNKNYINEVMKVKDFAAQAEYKALNSENKVCLKEIPIERIVVSVRAYNALKKYNILDIWTLVMMPEYILRKKKGIGVKVRRELIEQIRANIPGYSDFNFKVKGQNDFNPPLFVEKELMFKE